MAKTSSKKIFADIKAKSAAELAKSLTPEAKRKEKAQQKKEKRELAALKKLQDKYGEIK